MKLRPVLKGEPISVAVIGGYIRRPAPSDGLEFETDEHAWFVAAEELTASMIALDRRRFARLDALAALNGGAARRKR